MENRRQRPRATRLRWFTLGLLCLLLSACTGKPSQVVIQPASVAVNPPCTQHEVVAHVTDAEGRPICNCRVEWILPRSRDAVGAIVDTPEQWGSKKTNTYARTLTDGDGNAKITITSTKEGRTPIIAMVPGIEDKAQHKVFAVKHWLKAAWTFPLDASTQEGGTHDIVTSVYRTSCEDSANPEPLPGYRVELEILSGPKAFFKDPLTNQETQQTRMETETDETGLATIQVYQKEPALGENKIRITIKHPDNSEELCCPKNSEVIATGEMTQTWTLAN